MNNTHPSNLKVRRLSDLPEIPQEHLQESVLYATADNKDWKVGVSTYLPHVVDELREEIEGIAEGPQGPVGPEGPEGPMGPQGPEGPQGQQGPAGTDGAAGAQGPRGPQGEIGPQGPEGPEGPQGPEGPAGEDGAGIEISGSAPTYADLPDDLGPGDAGSGYLVQSDGKLYIWDGTQWPADEAGAAFRGPQGPEGPEGPQGPQGDRGPEGATGNTGADGEAATVDVGTVYTGAAGSGASVQNVGTPNEAIFDFVIPRGDKGETGEQGIPGEKGDDGTAATVAAGTTSTGSPGSYATVTNVGTENAAVFNFMIPRGEQGPPGEGSVSAPSVVPVNAVATLDETHVNAMCEKSAEGNITLTVPPDLGEPGDAIFFVNNAASGSLVIGRGAGVTILTYGSNANITIPANRAALIVRTTTDNKWIRA